MTTCFSQAPLKKRARAVLALAAALVFLSAAGCIMARPVAPRPDRWATAVSLDGVPNLYKVTDDLYRSAQPTAEGFRNLAKMGIKTVITFRGGHVDRGLLEGSGLDLVEMPMPGIDPKAGQVVRLLTILKDKSRCPVLAHCLYGADRTGAMVAAFRVADEGWTKDEAIAEMTGGGYGYHIVWTNLISFVRNLEVEELRAALETARTSPQRKTEDH